MVVAMPTAQLDDLDLCYESFGPDDAPPCLLVMGFTAQMTAWVPGFISELLERGLRVIRYDNRDCGLSSKSEGAPPDVADLMMRAAAGEVIEAPYSLSDMAHDGFALLDYLGIEAAHIVGASMGGMIVQTMAIEHPERCLSVTSIMSTTGNPEVGQADPAAMEALLTPPPEERSAAIEHNVGASKVLGGSLWDEQDARSRAIEAYDRCFHPPGAAFQMGAIAASGDRSEGLKGVGVPFLVIHGRQDPLLSLSGGLATAEAVPGADLVVFAEMGHDMPREYWPQIADAIIGIAGRA